ncbi:aquaporin AQPcic-like isoform X1 [Cimex lectularius]|uniref:Aquaglyceroporin 1 n=1 Tax=Cimex lectularius TaxID=79782 RepID=A0A165Y517_CIMLE|nr:aquaporin AQPcic-like isoform X1 [Cimex lectularius]AMZ04829.1 aquaglyceroporin 1 [Cimex lectularius]
MAYLQVSSQARVSDDAKLSVECAADNNIKIDVDQGAKTNDAVINPLRTYAEVFLAEALATGFLLSIGCMSCVEGVTPTPVTDFHSAVAFGFLVTILISVFGHISSAHMNPALTITFYLLGRISLPMVFVYFSAEVFGAVVGVGLVKLVTPPELFGPTLCVTRLGDAIQPVQGLAVEFAITFVLALLVCAMNDKRTAALQDSGSIKFGTVIIAMSLAAGKYTGASMNPARSLAPAIWSNYWTAHWIYWAGPIAAGIAAPLLYIHCFNKEN